ncbi:UNVERIFIED_CONTAM: hypothetical protein Slati_2496100 [Sesamum latifolium]|uniref:ATP-dependent DNA helicase n=1 Tax=Sesamum latifolium TaxID=2727402 RepID=A0AAW2WHK8_9LAMI
MVATATSGIAAIQLPGGRTAHSKLKIPIKLDSSSRCNFSKQSEVCQLLDRAAAIIWDEAPMADRKAIETVDRTLREIFGVDLPFGDNIRAQSDQSFFDFLLRIDLGSHTYDPEYMMDRAPITPLNDDVNKLNERVLQAFIGEEEVTYYSFDSVSEDMNNLYLPEFLNSLSPGNLPPHKLTLKKGAPLCFSETLIQKLDFVMAPN